MRRQWLHIVTQPIYYRKPWALFFYVGQIAIPQHDGRVAVALQEHDVLQQFADVVPQTGPLLKCELVCADQADTQAFAVIALRMRAHFIQVAAGGDCAIGVDYEVVADGGKIRVLPLSEFSRAFESTLMMPAVDIADRNVLAVRRGCAVNDDAFDLSCHAAMMAEEKSGNKAEGRPPAGYGRRKLTGYAGFV